MELNNKLSIGLYLVTCTIIAFGYILFTLFAMSFSKAYFSGSYPAWHHYFLWFLMPLMPVYIYIGYKNIVDRKTIAWLSSLIPVVWLFIMYLIEFSIRAIN